MDRAGASPCRGTAPPSLILLAVLLLLNGCTDDSPHLDPDLEGTMNVTPTSAQPGQEVTLRFPADSERGIAFSLSPGTNGERDPIYYLTSDWGDDSRHRPSWWLAADSADRGWEQVGISGPGPDRVLIPDTATPGDYLLCTANAVDEACALLTVTD